MTEKNTIQIPKELLNDLNFTDNEEVQIEITNRRDSFVVRTVEANNHQDYAARWFLLPTALSTLIFIISTFFFHPHVIPLSGSLSIATGVLTISTTAAIATFIIAYIKRRKSLYRTMTSRIYWRTFPIIIASLILILLLLATAIFWFIDQIFHGVAFDRFTSTLIFTLFSAILIYLVIFMVDTFNVDNLVTMLITTILGGMIASMATNGNKFWWQKNFSFLGTSSSHSAWQFNLTLVIAAALFLALVDYIFVSLADKFGSNWRHLILRLLLSGAALCIAGVGLVPNDSWGHIIHDHIALMIVYFMGVAILGLPFFMPKIGKNIRYLSYTVLIALAVSYILWRGFHYFSLTAFEILSFSLSFAWFLLLLHTLLNLLLDEKRTYKLKVRD